MNIGRLPHPTPDELSADQRAVYDEIVGGPRGSGPFPLTDDEGRLHGPFNAMLVHPGVGLSLQRLGADIRYRSALEARERELAILAVARLRDSDFEWYAHERAGLAAGLTPGELDALDRGATPDTLGDRERTVLLVTRALVVDRDLGDATFADAARTLGLAVLADLVTLVGYYDLLALSLRIWRVPLPSGHSRRPGPGPTGSGTAPEGPPGSAR